MEVYTIVKWTDKFGSLEVYKIVNGLISLEVYKSGSLQNCKWTDKFGSLEVYKIANGLISLEVYKIVNGLISLEVSKFTKL